MIRLDSDAIWSAGRVGSQSTGLDRVSNNRLASPGTVLAGVKPFGLQRVSDIPGDAHGNLAASISVAAIVAHCAQSR
ncbi:hypothetical protein D9M68_679130 [compost metagenome]